MFCPIVLKFNTLVRYGTLKVADLLKFSSSEIQDGGRPNFLIFQSL